MGVTGFLAHEHAVRRQGCQGQGREGVHDEVDPQHLGNGERRLLAEERADGDDQTGTHIDRQLEQNEALDIAIEGTSPQHGLVDACK